MSEKNKLNAKRMWDKRKNNPDEYKKICKKFSDSHRSKRGFEPPMKGKKHSEETKTKIRKSKIGKSATWNMGRPMPEISGKNNWRWSGGEHKRRRGHEWQLIRKQVLIRFEFKCVHCGVEGTLDIHHIIPYKKVKEHKIENLIPLCKSCHRKEEAKIIKNKHSFY